MLRTTGHSVCVLALMLTCSACSSENVAPAAAEAGPEAGAAETLPPKPDARPERPEGGPAEAGSGDGGSKVVPIYVTIAGHIEDSPQFARCAEYPENKRKLVAFASKLAAAGLSMNLQSDYEFFTGAKNCETAETLATTEGKNIFEYLVTKYGFEIDAHQEGGWDWEPDSKDNYADVRYLGGQVTASISETLGGIVYDRDAQFLELASGQKGRLSPTFTWSPKIATMAVSLSHHQGDFSKDDNAFGVWRPKGPSADFYTHDPAGRIVAVGNGYSKRSNESPVRCEIRPSQTVALLVGYQDKKTIPTDKLLTVTYAVPQNKMLEEANHAALFADLAKIQAFAKTGRVVFRSFRKVVETWETDFGSQGYILPASTIQTADLVCE